MRKSEAGGEPPQEVRQPGGVLDLEEHIRTALLEAGFGILKHQEVWNRVWPFVVTYLPHVQVKVYPEGGMPLFDHLGAACIRRILVAPCLGVAAGDVLARLEALIHAVEEEERRREQMPPLSERVRWAQAVIDAELRRLPPGTLATHDGQVRAQALTALHRRFAEIPEEG